MQHYPALPPFPCLRPGTELVPVDRENVLLRSFSGTVLLSGEFVSSELPALLPRLDGSRSVHELFEMVGEDFRPELEKFLQLMTEKNILYPGDSARADSRPQEPSVLTAHERAYWSLDAATATDAVRHLQSSTVVLANLGGVGVSIARALATSGVGKLVLLDADSVRPSDELFGYGAEHVGKPRVETIAADISNLECKDITTIVSTVDGASNWDQIVSGATVVILCSDNMSLAGYDRTNEACIRHGTRWVSARIDRGRGIIGPFIVPEQTACFACFELRNRANSDHPKDHEMMYRHWKQMDVCPESWPAVAPFSSIIGNYVALDLLQVLAGNHVSAFFGRVLHLDLRTLESRFHSILKLPRCPACSRGRTRPLTRIWDIRPASDAKRPADQG